jgi:Fungal Zn(2)-Cys(6) binuclear cluster domain
MPHPQQQPYKTMAGRRSHRKSRQGCQQCKARKVKVRGTKNDLVLCGDVFLLCNLHSNLNLFSRSGKCDETKPLCKNCIKHGVDCSFNPIGLTPPSQVQASPPPSPFKASLPAFSESGTVSNLNYHDLELLHHYTTATYLTLGQNPTLQILWRVAVPQIGFSYPYVLRVILAISALHLAYLQQEERAHYIAQAAYHHEVALQNVAPSLEIRIAENPTAVFAFSVLTYFIACAKPRAPGDFFLLENGELSQWLVLFRATGTIFRHSGEELVTGPLAPLFHIALRQSGTLETKPAEKPDFLEALESLTSHHGRGFRPDRAKHLPGSSRTSRKVVCRGI